MTLSALVTVGTTSFPILTNYIIHPSTLIFLRSLNITTLTIQYGSVSLNLPPPSSNYPIITSFPYTTHLNFHIRSVDLLITHAGAGTILEAVALAKPMLVVVNDKLMHNHQTHLANAMFRRKCCVFTTAANIQEEFNDKLRLAIAMDFDEAKPPVKQPYAFSHVLYQQLH